MFLLLLKLAFNVNAYTLLTAHPSAAGGLGWGGNMRFRTGLNLIDLTAEVSRRLEHVKFPFLIMHDPEDSEFDGVFIASTVLLFGPAVVDGSRRSRPNS